MPVLLITAVYPPRHGGSGRWFEDLYARLGSTVVAAGPSDDPVADAVHDVASPIAVERVFFPPPGTGLIRPSSALDYMRCYRDLRRIVCRDRVAAVHAGCVLPEGLLGAALAARFRLPLTVYVHGEEVRGAALGRELNALARLTFRRASRIVANTQNTASLLDKYWELQSEKVCVLHPGVDASRFVPAPRNPASRAALGWGDRPVVLTVGRLQARKGQDVLIRAMPAIRQSVPDVLYAVVGAGDYEATLRSLAEECGVADAVLFHGAVAEDTMLAAHQQCDLFALPNRDVESNTEGFGIVLLEAAACRKPTVCGTAGGTGEAIEDGATGVRMDCEDPSAVASEIVSLLTNPGRSNAMGYAGRKRVERRFDWPTRVEVARSLFDMGPGASPAELAIV
ncbi:glycosyltransferase family 4 protein [Alienimonas californiensis]|uniref:glycosyltransferase family 4 protein n=1 Tax=Alienimonas californiensis TaxID=2527989 RepID=UPI0013FD011A|nr:glycosyltransferase family 4 protein [Alienimonas californiensis]